MRSFKVFLTVMVLGVANPVFSQDVKKNRDQICKYVSSIGNWVQGVINTFEGIVRFGSGKGFSKAEMLAMKDQWIKIYKQRDTIAKENIMTCNIRGNPFKKWERSHLNIINKNMGKANKMAGQLEAFLNNYPDLKKLPACRDFSRAWKRMKKPDNYFR